MYLLDKTQTLKTNLEGKKIVEFPVLYIVIKGFYAGESLADIMKVETKSTKSKAGSLLMSRYSFDETGKDMAISSDDDADEDEPSKVMDISNVSDEDEVLDEAFDYLSGGTLRDVLSSLYKQTELNG